MAGFNRVGTTTPAQGLIFTVSDFGTPFESVLEGQARPMSGEGDAAASGGAVAGGGCELSFAIRMKPKLAWVFGVVLVASVWPGVWLTDSMIRTYFPSYDYKTWMWYIPLTAPFVPLGLMQAIKKSRASAQIEAAEIIERIRTLVQGRSTGGGGAGPSGGIA